MQASTKLSPQQRKRLDRQRFIGLETQKKLINSRILITPLNGPNTELAKNLVLAGVNVTIYDGATAKQEDFQNNFLIGLDDIGKKRGEVIFNRLDCMNPYAVNQFLCQDLDVDHIKQEFFDKFTVVCTSFNQFSVVDKWDAITKKVNKPYYNMFSAGLYAFAYISLGSEYTYKQPLTKKHPKKYIIPSLTLKQCLSKQQVEKSKKKQTSLLQGILSNPNILFIVMYESQKTGLSYDSKNPLKMHEEMLYCMVQLGQNIKQADNRQFLLSFAQYFGVEYCPVYSVIGSIVSQEIIKVVENQQEPAVNWIVMNSDEGYACVLKIKSQDERIKSEPLEIINE